MASLEFSEKEKFAVAAFKKYRNTIIIYTEDREENEKLFYKIFFKALLIDTSIEINDIFPIGNCIEVDKREKEDKDFVTPKIFITDGDIFLMYKPRRERRRYYPLPRYCIENYLINENQICNCAEIFNGKKTADEIKTELHYTELLQEFANNIMPVFYYYSLLSEKIGAFEIDRYGRFYNHKTHTFMRDKIEELLLSMRKKLLDYHMTEEEIDKSIQQKEKQFPKTIKSLKKVVSAKNFTFPYLKECINTTCHLSSGVPNEAWKGNCAKFIDINELSELREKIIGLCS